MKPIQLKNSQCFNFAVASICCILLCIVSPLNAENGANRHGLFIKPKSCVLNKSEHFCEQQVQVVWKIEKQQPVCLYIQDRPKALACWDNQIFDSSDFMIETNKKIIFQLKNNLTNEVLFSTTYKVYKKIAQYRKKRRNPWSFY